MESQKDTIVLLKWVRLIQYKIQIDRRKTWWTRRVNKWNPQFSLEKVKNATRMTVMSKFDSGCAFFGRLSTIIIWSDSTSDNQWLSLMIQPDCTFGTFRLGGKRKNLSKPFCFRWLLTEQWMFLRRGRGRGDCTKVDRMPRSSFSHCFGRVLSILLSAWYAPPLMTIAAYSPLSISVWRFAKLIVIFVSWGHCHFLLFTWFIPSLFSAGLCALMAASPQLLSLAKA